MHDATRNLLTHKSSVGEILRPTKMLGKVNGVTAAAANPTARTRGSAAPLVRERAAFLVEVLGGAELARWLGVSRSQPTRWRQGAEVPGPEAARELVDLDHVVARALMLFPARVAVDWLTSSNEFLTGARPVDVLKVRGSAEVIAALDAAESGAIG